VSGEGEGQWSGSVVSEKGQGQGPCSRPRTSWSSSLSETPTQRRPLRLGHDAQSGRWVSPKSWWQRSGSTGGESVSKTSTCLATWLGLALGLGLGLGLGFGLA